MIFDKMLALVYALLRPAFASCQHMGSPSHLLMCLAAGGGALMHIDLLVKYLPVAVLYSDHMERDSDLVVRSVRNTRPTG